MSRFALQLANLALAELSPALIEEGVAEPLRRAASRVTAAAGIGLEARLGAKGGAIDAFQRFRHGDDTLPPFLDWVRAHATGPDAAVGWSRLLDFCNLWLQDPGFIREVWVEFDATGSDRPLPALFMDFADDLRGQKVENAIRLLAGDTGRSWGALGDAFAHAQRLGIRPTAALGLMLSRDDAIRGTFVRPGLAGARALLEALDWRGPWSDLKAVLQTPELADSNHQLALDFAPDLKPVAGIEFVFNNSAADQKVLERILHAFVRQGWATQARCEGLLDWSGVMDPRSTQAPWPDAMIAREVIDPRPHLLVKHVGHLKLNLAPGTPPVAKGYFALIREPAGLRP